VRRLQQDHAEEGHEQRFPDGNAQADGDPTRDRTVF
jgi:hypothetical protein